MGPPNLTAKNKRIIDQFLLDHNSLSLSYICEDQPEVCAVWYASDGLNALYFLSSLTTKHGTTLQSVGNVAFTIHRDKQDWFKIKGIQGKGIVRLLGRLTGKGWKIYQEKYPILSDKNTALEIALEAAYLWRINPTWIRLIDNSKEFGYKIEIQL